ncbi:histidine kinase [Actinopolymorpha sp. B11F2]|uniref:sensor histidine kinase n=1 Tax=Actinopolymorpha sp. B11F2 TaxID=3160862 RepID=UPI0032E4EC9B
MERIWRMLGSRRAVDFLIWAAITAPVFLGDDGLPPGSVLSMPTFQGVAVALLAVAVLLSRSVPLVAVVLPTVFAVAVTGEIYCEQLTLAQVTLAFLLGRRTAGGRSVVQLLAALCAVVLAFAVVNQEGTAQDWFTLASTTVLQVALPWTAGQYVLQRAELLRAGWELAERLEREQGLVANQVRLRERARIARDMHDSLGHELSLIAVRAAGFEVTTGIGPQGRQAAGELRQAAALATDRLREIIGMLRDDGETPPVVPAGGTVQSLVTQAAASGVAVTLEDATADFDTPVPDVTARAAYRVVQEALTNAIKHAPGAAVAVIVRGHDEGEQGIVVTVVNGAPPMAPPQTDGLQGYGLIGLDERVRLVGGTLDARPTDGGFTVTAWLPLTPMTSAAAPVAAPTSSHALSAARRRLHRSMIETFLAPAAMAVVLVLFYVLNADRL